MTVVTTVGNNEGRKTEPDQILSALASQTPERRFMMALLDDAVACFRGIDELPTLKKRQLARSAKRWLMADDIRHPLSFRNVCNALAMDPELVRSSLGLPKRRLLTAAADSMPKIGGQAFARPRTE